MKHCLCLIALLFVACGKDAPLPEVKTGAAPAPAKPAPEKKLPPVPQGPLPKMDPEKAKFIAVPSTPEDPEPKKADKPDSELKKAEAPTAKPEPEIKKAAPAAQK